MDGLKAELVTIEENLARRILSDANRAYQTSRRKEIYEALHPETRNPNVRGGPGRPRKNDGQIGHRFQDEEPSGQIGHLNETECFTAATAKATGRGERTIRREAARGGALGETLNRIKGTSLDKGVEIDALAASPHQERENLVARAEQGEKVSARKPNLVPIDTDELQANTIARRLLRDYLDAPRKAQKVFDELYVETRSGQR